MSKTATSALLLIVIIIGGYFIIKHGKGVEPAPAVDTEMMAPDQTAQTSDTSGKKIPFSEFVKQGGAYKCDVKQATGDFQNTGTVYISGANIRGDFSTIAEGRPMQTSFITTGGFSYTWSPDLPNVGFKVKVSTDTGTDVPNWPDQIGDYTCVPWTADASMFVVPVNITFKTTGA